MNAERDGAGCGPLRQHSLLAVAADAHSRYMARSGRLSHRGQDGSTPAGRLNAAGYGSGRAGETLAAGPADPQAVVRAWMSSPPHRGVLLTCAFLHVGLGRTDGRGGPWWTLLLAAPR
ncbi:CAP domain-containing protein [Streptomyces sp. NPDC054849]